MIKQQKTFLLLLILPLMIGCTTKNIPSSSAKSLEVETFLKSPFGHDESIASFRSTLPRKTAIRKMVTRNKHYPEKADTIYRFVYKKSEIFVYKSSFNKEILMTGSIVDPQVELANGIVPGISKEQLFSRLKGLKQTEVDTIKVSTPSDDRRFIFILKNGKVKKITFASYYD